MPVYQYKCDKCESETTEVRSLNERNEIRLCSCGGAVGRKIETGRKISVRCDWEDYRGMRE